MPSERIQRRIDSLLDQAEEAIEAGEWDRAQQRAEDALALDPENEDAQSILGGARRRLDGARATPTPPSSTPVPAPQLPDAFVGGRYRVERFLGEGGKKRVFLAHDTTLDRDVAFGQFRTEGMDAASRARVAQEAQAMGRVGTHANLVAIYDIGEERGAPYIVQEYVPGGSLADLVRDEPLPLDQTLRLSSDVCAALTYIHGQQLVHRDIKPSNVFLTEDGSAKVGDFGLAVGLDRTRITMQGGMIGTPSYMPPEQALGGDVTPQSDLYSLGATLYELVTGRPPFVGDDPTSVISQHINTPPVAPSWHSEHCPPDLEELILHCLAKAPDDRPASAAEVREALSRIDPAAKSRTHSDSGANPLDRLARGVFVGREAELERLRTGFDRAYAGSGNLAMLVGEPGIGKTRTTEELATYARMRGALVLWGRTHESAGMPPYWPWLQIGNSVSAEDLTAIGPDMPPQATSELSRIFAWLRDQPNYLPPEEVNDPEVAQFRLFDAYSTFMRVMSDRYPLVVVLDDLHWADKPSLLLLQFMARELRGHRILVVATFRDTDLVRTHPLSETLAELNREPGFDRIVLRGLTRAEVQSYISATANRDPGSAIVQRIFEETEGNPFFLSEVVQLMAQEGRLRADSGFDSLSEIALPDGVREALGRRLDGLSEESQALLQMAAIVGREFAYEVLTLLGDQDDDALLALIEEAIASRVIEETDRPGRYRFTHALMQETLLDELSTTRRIRLHGRVAEALEQRWGQLADQRASRLAQHFMESATLTASHTERALHYSMLAGAQAEEQAGFGEGARHYRACLALIDDSDEPTDQDQLITLLTDLGRCERNANDAREAWRHLMRAIDLTRGVGDATAQARAVLEAVQLWAPTARLNPLLDGAIAALDATPEPDPFLLGLLLAQRSSLPRAITADQIEQARVAGARARGLLSVHDLPAVEGVLINSHEAPLAWQQHDTELAQKRQERAIELLDRVGVLRESASSRRNLGAWLMTQFRVAEGVEAAQRALAFARSRGIRNEEELAAFQTCYFLTVSGRLDEALTVARSVPEDHYLVATAEALVLAVSGEPEAARRRLPGPADFPPVPELLAQAEAYRAEVLHYIGDVEACRASLTRYQELYAEASLVMISGTWASVALALLEHGSPDQIREVAADAGPYAHDPLYAAATGTLALALGDLERAEELLSSVEAAARDEDVKFPLGTALMLRGEIARRRGAPTEALSLLDEAQHVFQQYGAAGLVNEVIAKKLALQGGAGSDSQTSLVSLTTSVEDQRPDVASAVAPDGTVTLPFSDIEDSTKLNVELGDDAWMRLLGEHNGLVRAAISEHRGFEVKTEGDAFMVAFGSARDAVRCAQAMQRALDARTEEPRLRIRIGLHTGEPVREADDFYGTHVVLASRICSQAAGGEILVSSLLRDLVASSGEFALAAREPVVLKGLDGEHVTYAVGWA